MASFYSSEGDHMLPNEYLQNQKLASYRSSELSNNSKLHVTQPSGASLSYSNFPSLSAHEFFEPESIENRDEMVFIPPTSVDQINRQLNFNPRYSDGNSIIADTGMFPKEEVSQYHGLSLSLGSQDLNQYANSSLCSLLNSENTLKNVQYLTFDSPGKNVQYSDFSGAICNSKYLRAARELLDELVNVHRVSKLSVGSTGTDAKRDGFGEVQESTNDGPRELAQSERHELQNKLTKLVSMLDEVDRRYKQYWHQMQALVSSVDTVAGPGAALPYTSLALRTISRQFRSLRDAVKKHILSTQKSLGDQDVSSHGVLSRLRYVDQQLRQQKSIQQFGVMRQPWRPQRGLPENAVSVLRAWLFEHFLHPYPKDSEKIVLARETGLTRSQVANWFINARVRLWKPMIEEMYKEEFGDEETELKSSPEQATTTQDTSAFTGPSDNHGLQSIESRPDLVSNPEMDPCRGLTYANGFFPGNEVNFCLTDHMQTKHDFGNSNFCDNKASQVTLALGLERISEKDSKPVTENEYYYVGPANDQSRFANPHLLSDYVA